MNVAQLQLSFDAEQDRLLFRMNGDDGAELRAWLTRRMIKLLWPNLLGILGKKIALETPAATPEAQRMLAGMQHEAQVRGADFSQPFRAQAQHFPLGEQPLLVTRVDLTLLPSRQILFAMKSPQGASIDVNMDEALFHGLCRLLQQSCELAGWDMRLQFPGQEADAPAQGDARVLN
jgi:hypothetical protein